MQNGPQIPFNILVLSKYWSILSQAGIWIFGIVGGFLSPPPIGTSSEDEKTWIRLAQFVITILLGLAFIAGRRLNKRKHMWYWWFVSAMLLLLSTCSFLGYQRLSLSWTCNYNNATVVIGDQYTERARRFILKYSDDSCEFLIDSAAGNTQDIWTKESIDKRRIVLASAYISSIPLFTICIIAVVQALQIVGQTERKPRQKRQSRAVATPSSKS